MKVTAVTLNPAIDRTYYVDGFFLDKVNRAEKINVNSGGKGINFIRALSRGGVDCVASGFLGRGAENILQTVQKEGIEADFVEVDSDIRVNIKICDLKNGTYTDLNESGAAISADETDAILKKVALLSKNSGYFYMGGSLPTGVNSDIYKKMIEICKENGVKTVLDTSGTPLKEGVLAKPDIIKPNKAEAQELLGRKISSFSDAVSAAREIQDFGVSTVLLSMGDEGCVCAAKDEVYTAQALKITAKSTVGAGDTFLAGYVYGRCQKMDVCEALKCAISFASAKVQFEGNYIPDFDTLMMNKDKIICRKIGG